MLPRVPLFIYERFWRDALFAISFNKSDLELLAADELLTMVNSGSLSIVCIYNQLTDEVSS